MSNGSQPGSGPVDAGPGDAGPVGEPCAGPNPDPAPGVWWENTQAQDAGLWVGPPAGPGELVFVPERYLTVSAVMWVDVVASVLPVVDNIKDVYEAVTGRGLFTGEELGAFDRVMAAVGALGVVGEVVSFAANLTPAARVATAYADDLVDVAKTADDARVASTGVSRSEATLKFFDALDEANAALKAVDAYGEVGRAVSMVSEIDTASDYIELAKALIVTLGWDTVAIAAGVADVEWSSTSDADDAGHDDLAGPGTYDDGYSTQLVEPGAAVDDGACYPPADDEPSPDGSFGPAADEPALGDGGGPAPDEPDRGSANLSVGDDVPGADDDVPGADDSVPAGTTW